MQRANITLENNWLVISGELDFFTVTKMLQTSRDLLRNVVDWRFDLSQVTSSNSAALALLLEWVKQAKRYNKNILFKKIPPQIISIAAVAGVDKFLEPLSVT